MNLKQNVHIGDLFVNYRIKNNLSQEAFAKMLNLNAYTIQRAEGSGYCTNKTLLKFKFATEEKENDK